LQLKAELPDNRTKFMGPLNSAAVPRHFWNTAAHCPTESCSKPDSSQSQYTTGCCQPKRAGISHLLHMNYNLETTELRKLPKLALKTFLFLSGSTT